VNDPICKGCGARIQWVTLNGKWHPAEATNKTIIVGGKLVSGPESHYANCPKADAFRNRRRG
jgi:dissimilatory sulfite reductase (desulfoviridin) alpha/beta subunit